MHGMQTEAGAPVGARRTSSTRPGRRTLALLVVVAVLGYTLDQLTKAWAVSSLMPGQPRQVVGQILQFDLVRNPGAAFSFATNATWVLTGIAIVVVGVICFVARRLRSWPWAVALGLLLAGAVGNLTDRFVRPPGGGQGHVIDFLRLPHWPVFNVADICVVTAACLIALLAIRGVSLDGSAPGDVPEGQPAPDEGADDSAAGGRS